MGHLVGISWGSLVLGAFVSSKRQLALNQYLRKDTTAQYDLAKLSTLSVQPRNLLSILYRVKRICRSKPPEKMTQLSLRSA